MPGYEYNYKLLKINEEFEVESDIFCKVIIDPSICNIILRTPLKGSIPKIKANLDTLNTKENLLGRFYYDNGCLYANFLMLIDKKPSFSTLNVSLPIFISTLKVVKSYCLYTD